MLLANVLESISHVEILFPSNNQVFYGYNAFTIDSHSKKLLDSLRCNSLLMGIWLRFSKHCNELRATLESVSNITIYIKDANDKIGLQITGYDWKISSSFDL